MMQGNPLFQDRVQELVDSLDFLFPLPLSSSDAQPSSFSPWLSLRDASTLCGELLSLDEDDSAFVMDTEVDSSTSTARAWSDRGALFRTLALSALARQLFSELQQGGRAEAEPPVPLSPSQVNQQLFAFLCSHETALLLELHMLSVSSSSGMLLTSLSWTLILNSLSLVHVRSDRPHTLTD
jgi:hypothetical protein